MIWRKMAGEVHGRILGQRRALCSESEWKGKNEEPREGAETTWGSDETQREFCSDLMFDKLRLGYPCDV